MEGGGRREEGEKNEHKKWEWVFLQYYFADGDVAWGVGSGRVLIEYSIAYCESHQKSNKAQPEPEPTALRLVQHKHNTRQKIGQSVLTYPQTPITPNI